MRRFLWGFVFAFALLIGAGLTAVMGGFMPVGADVKPSWFEHWLSTTALDRGIARGSQNLSDPLPTSDENLMAGVKLYGANCVYCHGASDSAGSNAQQGMNVRPPLLAKDGVEDDPEGETYWKIKHGIRLTGMPSFGSALSDTQIWQLTQFLKHMDKLPPAVDAAFKQIPSVGQTPNPEAGAPVTPVTAGTPGAAATPSSEESPPPEETSSPSTTS